MNSDDVLLCLEVMKLKGEVTTYDGGTVKIVIQRTIELMNIAPMDEWAIFMHGGFGKLMGKVTNEFELQEWLVTNMRNLNDTW